jgi:hypothetical protein
MKDTMEGFLVRGFIMAGMCAGLVFATTPVFSGGPDNGDYAKVYSSDHKGDGHDDPGDDHKGDGHGKGSH